LFAQSLSPPNTEYFSNIAYWDISLLHSQAYSCVLPEKIDMS
jgi:hypothetical protein